MKILITGGSGFIGANLINELVNTTDYKIIATENRGSVPVESDRVKTIKVDFSDYGDIQKVFDENEFNIIVHTAAVVSFRKKHHKLMYQVNVEGTKHLVNLALERGIKRFIYVSSVAALSKNEKKLITEDDIFEENDNSSFYGKTKYLGELEVWRGQEEGLNVTVINPSVVLGPSVSGWKRSSAGLFYRVYKGIPFFPPGRTGFVSVNDVVNILVKSIQQPDKSVGKKWIVSAENLTWKQVLGQIAELLGVNKPKFVLPSTILKTYAAISRFLPENILPFSYEEAISTTLNLQYDNSKIRGEFYPEFESIKDVIRTSCRKFLEDIKK